MKRILTYLLLLTAGILSLTPSWGQADTLCVSNPVGTYYVQGWAGSTFSWNTQGDGVIQSGQGNDTVVVQWNTLSGTFQLEVIETSLEGCVGPPRLMDIVILPSSTSTVNAAICSSSTYTLPDGSTVSSTGTYPVTLTANNGCDSIITTHLTVQSVLTTSVNASICLGDDYVLPDGTHVNTNGSYPVTLNSSGGCDSIITTFLSVNQPINTALNASTCFGTAYTLPDGSQVNSAGVYPVTIQGSTGCDSTITTTLSIHPTEQTVLDINICSGTSYLLPDGQIVSTTGSYNTVLQTTLGCDSLVIVNLNVAPTPTVSISSSAGNSICQGSSITLTASGANSYTWLPTTGLSASNVAVVDAAPDTTTTYTVVGTLGNCSSVASFMLTVNASPIVAITPNNPTICLGDSVSLTASGANTYQWSPATWLSSSTVASVMASPPVGSTQFTVIGSNGNCSSTQTVTVLVTSSIQLSLVAQYPVICTGSSTLIIASGAASYSWQNDPSLSTLSGDSVYASPGIQTSYFVTGVLGNCTAIDSISIDVQAYPVISLTSTPDSTCAGTPILLSALGAESYSWSPSNGLSQTFGDTVIATVFDDFTYYVNGTTGNCTTLDSVLVNIIPSPHLILQPESTVLCAGDTVQLSASGADAYSWNPSDSIACPTCPTILVSPSSTTNYEIIGTRTGCADTSSVLVQVIERPIPLITGDTAMCANGEITLEASGGSSYLWSTGDSISTITVHPEITTVYSVLVNEGLCPDSAEHLIVVFPAPDVHASEDTTIRQGGSANLAAVGGYQYYWSPSLFLSCDNCPNPIASPEATTTYCVTGTNFYGCEASDCVEVKVEIICDDFFIPNVFSPTKGGDPENDCFRLYGTNCITELKFRIFNRWGELVFETNDKSDCWDGTFKGQDQNSGVFVYYLEAKLINDEKIEKQGNITLLR